MQSMAKTLTANDVIDRLNETIDGGIPVVQ
jgi:hypothetical protein